MFYSIKKSKSLIIVLIGLSLPIFYMVDGFVQDTNVPPDVQVFDPNDTSLLFTNEIETFEDNCAKASQNLDRCSAQLIAFGESSAQLPDNMNEMDSTYCPRFKKTIDCIRASSDCYKPFERQIINWVLASVRRMNHRRCKIDSEKEKFLRLTNSCLSTIKEPTDRCMSKYIANLESIADLDGKSQRFSESDRLIQLSCCANDRFKQCIMNQAKKSCRPADSLLKLKRTNSVTSQKVAKLSLKKASVDMMDDLRKKLNAMALTGPEFICRGVNENFCRSNFEGKFNSRPPRHASIVPAMIQIYSNDQQ